MTKISELPGAGSLSGFELIALAQGARTVQSEVSPIASIAGSGNFVRVGAYAAASEAMVAIGAYAEAVIGYSTIAVGSYAIGVYNASVLGSEARAMSGVVLGNTSYSFALNGIAIGQYASASNTYAIAIGCYLEAGTKAIGMGFQSYTKHCDYSIAIGKGSHTDLGGYHAKHAIAIGYNSAVFDAHGIGIGYRAHGTFNSVAIGWYAGNYAISGDRNVDIGAYTYSQGDASVALG